MLVEKAKLAWQFYRQEYHLPQQRLLRWTQLVLLVFMLALSQSSQSVQQYLTQNLQGLLGADALISQRQQLSSEQHHYYHPGLRPRRRGFCLFALPVW